MAHQHLVLQCKYNKSSWFHAFKYQISSRPDSLQRYLRNVRMQPNCGFPPQIQCQQHPLNWDSSTQLKYAEECYEKLLKMWQWSPCHMFINHVSPVTYPEAFQHTQANMSHTRLRAKKPPTDSRIPLTAPCTADTFLCKLNMQQSLSWISHSNNRIEWFFQQQRWINIQYVRLLFLQY